VKEPVKSTSRLLALLLPLLLASGCVYWTPRSLQPGTSAAVIPGVPVQTWDITSCGAGALSSVLQHFGDPTTMAEWQESLPKTRGGVMSIDLVLAARAKGFDARLTAGDESVVAAELLAGNPVIAMLQVVQAPGKGYDFFHYVVIDGYDAERRLFRTQFGDGKIRWVRIERIEPAWKATKHATIVIRRPDPAADALRAAVQLEEEARYALAAHAYREILARHPDSVLAWTNLGNSEMRLGRRAAAEEAFRKALALRPESADTLNNLAWLLYEERRLEEAEVLARKAVEATAPDRWTRLDTLARVLAARGDCEGAASAFRAALDEVPEARREDRAAIESAAREACGTAVS
jgi:tetratricopeptide (TPR) repeat protein